MSWQEVHRIQQLESQVRKLEDQLAALEARILAPLDKLIWGNVVEYEGKTLGVDIHGNLIEGE